VAEKVLDKTINKITGKYIIIKRKDENFYSYVVAGYYYIYEIKSYYSITIVHSKECVLLLFLNLSN